MAMAKWVVLLVFICIGYVQSQTSYNLYTNQSACMIGVQDEQQKDSSFLADAVIVMAETECISFSKSINLSTSYPDDCCGAECKSNYTAARDFIHTIGTINDSCAYKKGNGNCDSANSCAHYKGAWKSLNGVQSVQQTLTTVGPVIALVDAHTWTNYTGGIVTTSNSCGKQLNISVMIVGWGQESIDSQIITYWIVENTLGKKGFAKIQLGENVCGIETSIYSILPHPTF
eukprot:TRINITY_DN56_c0_g1_i1.p1 TRINITY_DN56_c0_g1~~TRINITY_DN56_c0_g1_i1.p1  ORF type:complete len:230 (-),score=37.79 TRINITY_DN56_c0_g1_i1:20-709(-)